MSDQPNVARQKRAGYALLASAVLLAIGTAVVFRYQGLPAVSYLGILVPVGILSFFGYRAVSASRDRVVLQDERTQYQYEKAGFNAFWFLMSAIFVDEVISVLPEEFTPTIYAFIGLFFYGAFVTYYRYVG